MSDMTELRGAKWSALFITKSKDGHPHHFEKSLKARAQLCVKVRATQSKDTG